MTEMFASTLKCFIKFKYVVMSYHYVSLDTISDIFKKTQKLSAGLEVLPVAFLHWSLTAGVRLPVPQVIRRTLLLHCAFT